jgi:hypothetical protein
VLSVAFTVIPPAAWPAPMAMVALRPAPFAVMVVPASTAVGPGVSDHDAAATLVVATRGEAPQLGAWTGVMKEKVIVDGQVLADGDPGLAGTPPVGLV